VSFYFLIAEHTQSSRDTLSTLFYTMSISTIFWLIVSHPSPAAIPNLTYSITLGGNLGNLAVPAWSLLLWLGVFGSFVPMLMGFWSLRHISATAAGIGSTSEVIAAFVFGWLWLQEGVTGIQLVGALFVLIGIAIAQTSRKVAVEPSMIASTGEQNGEH
jgi:drug/metabolite transporter (DMT)-like permease